MRNFFFKIGVLVLGTFLLLQVLPVNRTNPISKETEDFLLITQAPSDIATIVKSSCYDCHSNHTVWPWYSYVAPVSWVVSGHVEEGRKELNFSEWTDYEFKRKDHKLEECVEALEDGWMPEEGYIKMHEKANLSQKQRELLIDFFKDARAILE